MAISAGTRACARHFIMLSRAHHPAGAGAPSTSASSTCECVAYITRTIEHGCKLGRLQMLVASAGPRWVYVLHHHDHTPVESVVATLRPRERVRIQPQAAIAPTSPWGLFGGKIIGYSKASFVLWMLRNGSACSRTWQVEDDVFYTGVWRSLFDAHAPDSADLLAITRKGQIVHEHSCFVNRDGLPCGSEGRVAGRTWRPELEGRQKAGLETGVTVTQWPLLRMSRRLAAEIERVLTVDGGKGFHEALTGPVCERASWCTISQLTHVGRLAAGHSATDEYIKDARPTLEWQAAIAADPFCSGSGRDPYCMKFQSRSSGWPYNGTVQVPPNLTWHPVKCEYDATLGAKARTWAGGAAHERGGCIA